MFHSVFSTQCLPYACAPENGHCLSDPYKCGWCPRLAPAVNTLKCKAQLMYHLMISNCRKFCKGNNQTYRVYNAIDRSEMVQRGW